VNSGRLTVRLTASAKASAVKKPDTTYFFTRALILALGASLLTAAQQPRTFDLEEATIADLQRRMATGQDTARSLAEKYLARIDALDRQGPSLRSILEINPDALSIADQLDAERKTRGPRGPLHGIPIVIKDNIATADRMMTTAGSLALVGVKPSKDAFIVTRLRTAGAVILGKTNLSEWANFRSSNSSSGWSARGGQTRNPYALDRSPSGSSSGSAVAVAANLAALAVGTETSGSIVSPSQANSVVGIKPTVGLLSRSGIIPIAHTQDTPGPLARTVADAAALLDAMAGADPDDEATIPHEGTDGYMKSLDPDGLKGARIGIVRKRLSGNSDETDRVITAAIADMKARGAVIVDPTDIPTLGTFDDAALDVLLYEFKSDLNTYLASLGPASPVHSLQDVIAFNNAHRDEELAYFGQELFIMAEAKGPLTSEAYTRARVDAWGYAGTYGIDGVMAKYRLDALVALTGGPAGLIDLTKGDDRKAFIPGLSGIAAVAGYPHITVPAGYIRGLPVGISFVGRAWSEPTLIKLAYSYEQATKHRRPPTFPPTAQSSQR
jgi:amidase